MLAGGHRPTPSSVDVRPVCSGPPLLDTWDVTFAGFGGDPVRAWYTRPSGVDTPLPASSSTSATAAAAACPTSA